MKKKSLYISVMGTMGSGKTTVSRLLARRLRYRLIEENFGENAFLPKFYADMKHWGFHSQTFFLMEKITQMLEASEALRSQSVMQDTPIVQDVFSYAKAQHVLGNMDDNEWRLYQKIYSSMEPHFPKPDLIIYLETSVPALTERIVHRGRLYEQKISQSYLELLDMLNHQWMRQQKGTRILPVSTDDLNIVKSGVAREKLIHLVKKEISMLH